MRRAILCVFLRCLTDVIVEFVEVAQLLEAEVKKPAVLFSSKITLSLLLFFF